MKQWNLKSACIAMVLVAGVACDRTAGQDAADTNAGSERSAVPADGQDGATPAPVEPVELEDVSEATADYIIGITYPQSATKYPRLAAELKAYAETARADLMEAVEARKQGEPAGEGSEGATLYDLSLTFTELVDTPELAAYAADGSMYTGGAHGMPLMERFVWLPQAQQRLTAQELVPTDAGWKAISEHAREQLHTALSRRADADAMSPAERSDLVRNTSRMIEAGTAPKAENFSEFEPLVDDAGRVTGLRFVFAPYQAGPYSDGTRSVEIPSDVLLPNVAPRFRDLFSAAPATDRTAGAPTEGTTP